MYFFTADEHYGHWRSPKRNIIRYCDRPFSSIEEMNSVLIKNHNSVVSGKDTVIHVGDFCLGGDWKDFLACLNGNHIFIKGSHDKWDPTWKYIWEGRLEKYYIVACHYAMRVWPRSHYNSWQVYGHSHGRLEPQGKQWDVGVDNNNFYPVSFEQLEDIMSKRPDNFNLVKK